MCQICKKAVTLPAKEGLELIGVAMKRGRNPEHFKQVMDRLLGTEEPEQDTALDAAWERGHRQTTGE